MFQGAAGHRLPGHLLVQVLLDDVVMLDELSKLLIGVIAAAAWKVPGKCTLWNMAWLARMAETMLERHWSPQAGRTSHGHELDVS